ncbi:MAG: YggS family pyridoxal phosphate-dependent enzyme [Candidatus Omnitrophota bacterium]|nr:YggS family pyridoxal phosphate-dependent enzyme [Candidatus Omnitrophota bacterium]
MTDIAAGLEHVREVIRQTAAKVGRDPAGIRYILVSKFAAADKILTAYNAGARVFGENRLQEFVGKKQELPSDIAWHFVGHLQTNKVKQVVGEVALIHSLDREELAHEIERQAGRKGIAKVPCLVEVNISGEAAKGGFDPDEVKSFIQSIDPDSPIELHGLMTIGPLTENKDEIKLAFRRMKKLFNGLREAVPQAPWDTLSMGMSGDYSIAIEEGANLLRIGRAVFGAREEMTK